jgi:hypothetical protein
MPENWFASRARVLAGLVESVGLYGAVCLSCGGLAVLACQVTGANPAVWFSAGFALPIGPMYLYLASDRVLEKRLIRWKRWRDEDLIGVGQYEQLRRDALAWYKARHRFGRLPSTEAIEGTTPPPQQLPPAAPSPTRVEAQEGTQG